MCSRFDTKPACDRRTDGIAVASTALAMRALRGAVKTIESRECYLSLLCRFDRTQECDKQTDRPVGNAIYRYKVLSIIMRT